MDFRQPVEPKDKIVVSREVCEMIGYQPASALCRFYSIATKDPRYPIKTAGTKIIDEGNDDEYFEIHFNNIHSVMEEIDAIWFGHLLIKTGFLQELMLIDIDVSEIDQSVTVIVWPEELRNFAKMWEVSGKPKIGSSKYFEFTESWKDKDGIQE